MEKINKKLKLLERLKKSPNSPGIYWFSKKGKKIYVGKAASLRKRISSYFRNKDLRIAEIVSEADNISFKKTNSVLEAVILESNAIKKYWPKYNIKEKDDRSFVYLVVSNGDYPKISISRGREVEKYIYPPHNYPRGQLRGDSAFGPYQNYKILRTALQLARKIFPFSNCRFNQGKPCFDYQIGLCPGICIAATSKKEYQKNIKNLILFFKGEHKRLFKKLKKENPEKIFPLKHIEDVALIAKSNITGLMPQRIEGYDISHFGGKDPVGAMAVFVNGFPDTSEYRLFKIKNTKNNFDDLTMISEILERRFNHGEWPKPDIILIDGGKNQAARAKKIMAEKNIFIPIVGIAKILGHSGAASRGDELIFANAKPSVKKLLISSRQLLQQVRNEAHRFAISFQRKRRKI